LGLLALFNHLSADAMARSEDLSGSWLLSIDTFRFEYLAKCSSGAVPVLYSIPEAVAHEEIPGSLSRQIGVVSSST
jgi:hypothetical protein